MDLLWNSIFPRCLLALPNTSMGQQDALFSSSQMALLQASIFVAGMRERLEIMSARMQFALREALFQYLRSLAVSPLLCGSNVVVQLATMPSAVARLSTTTGDARTRSILILSLEKPLYLTLP
jgi:hypothetical protein